MGATHNIITRGSPAGSASTRNISRVGLSDAHIFFDRTINSFPKITEQYELPLGTNLYADIRAAMETCFFSPILLKDFPALSEWSFLTERGRFSLYGS